MKKTDLPNHVFKKGKFITAFNDSFSESLNENTWKDRFPEFIWLALILLDGERSVQMQKCGKIISFLHQLDDNGEILMPQLSKVFELPREKQLLFYDFLNSCNVFSELSSLSIVFPEAPNYFREYLKGYNTSMKNRVEAINTVLNKYSNHQSEISTDLRFIILYYFTLTGKLSVSSDMIESIKKYPITSHSDPAMRLYRPTIRSIEIMMINILSEEDKIKSKEFAQKFWGKISRLTTCEGYYLEMKKDDAVDLVGFKEYTYEILSYYKKIFVSIDPLNNRMFTLLSIATYSYKRLIELVDHNLENTISGRSIVRSIIENYMITKFMLQKEKENSNIWEDYQIYGLGVYKKFNKIAKRDHPNNLDKSHMQLELLNLYVSEFKNEAFIDIDVRYFQGDIKKKFETINESDLYKYYYDYDSSFEHGLWGAIRESSVINCSAAGHQFHGIPDIDDEQKLSSVAYDVVMVLKRHLKLLNDEFGLPIDLQKGLEDEGFTEKTI